VTPGLRHHMDPGRNNPHRPGPGDSPVHPEAVRTSTHDPNQPPLKQHGHSDPPPARRAIWRRLRSQRP
jgi:hypothetical protein